MNAGSMYQLMVSSWMLRLCTELALEVTTVATEEEIQKIKDLWFVGIHNKSEIGRRLGHTSGWVNRCLDELGINQYSRKVKNGKTWAK